MRTLIVTIFSLVTLALVSCRKDPNTTGNFVYWQTCADRHIGNDVVTICFDSLVQDSRCPFGVLCIWEGLAAVQFSFSVNHNQSQFIMSPPDGPGLYPADTSVMGYRIRFLSLQPHPSQNYTRRLQDYKAEVLITKQ